MHYKKITSEIPVKTLIISIIILNKTFAFGQNSAINLEQLANMVFDSMNKEGFDKYNEIYSRLTIEELQKYNEIMLTKSLKHGLALRKKEKGIKLFKKQMIQENYNARIFHEIMLEYSILKYQKPYNQITREQLKTVIELVRKDSVYKSRKYNTCKP